MDTASPKQNVPAGRTQVPSPLAAASLIHAAKAIAPGLLVAAFVAAIASAAQPVVAPLLPIPAILLALFVGMILHPVARRPAFEAGLNFCVKRLLRWAVALLGIRIALSDIVALGLSTALLVVVSMAATLICGIALARLLRQDEAFGAIGGAATAVCGASAALATGAVTPDYKGKEADIVFVVIAVNALSTVAMILYPWLCVQLGWDDVATGIALGASIHDVAQVVGAGYAVSETAGNTAVIVKLFRVFLLLPVIVAIGYYFARRGTERMAVRASVPGFAIAFLVLCMLNSAVSHYGGLPFYPAIKGALSDLSAMGLLVAIGALGASTSFAATFAIGWRRAVIILSTTVLILAAVLALVALRGLG
ncbi:MAG: putative sulfate exporter family transporter [Pseudorhodoplanes sp.]|nr:putative sulfate exporter family transporter [Pseudorhodoplanes sp.]